MREHAGLKGEEVSEIIGVSSAIIYHWENGKYAIAKHYERDLLDIYGSVIAGAGVPAIVRKHARDRERLRLRFQSCGMESIPRQPTVDRAYRALAWIRYRHAEAGEYPSVSAIGRTLGTKNGTTAYIKASRALRILACLGHVRIPEGGLSEYELI